VRGCRSRPQLAERKCYRKRVRISRLLTEKSRTHASHAGERTSRHHAVPDARRNVRRLGMSVRQSIRLNSINPECQLIPLYLKRSERTAIISRVPLSSQRGHKWISKSASKTLAINPIAAGLSEIQLTNTGQASDGARRSKLLSLPIWTMLSGWRRK
jgi:hypothetical protein